MCTYVNVKRLLFGKRCVAKCWGNVQSPPPPDFLFLRPFLWFRSAAAASLKCFPSSGTPSRISFSAGLKEILWNLKIKVNFTCLYAFQLNLLCGINSDVILLLMFHLCPLRVPDWEECKKSLSIHLIFLFSAIDINIIWYCKQSGITINITITNRYWNRRHNHHNHRPHL